MARMQPLRPAICVNTRQIFNYHIKIFKTFGIWLPKSPSHLDRLHTLLAFSGSGFLLIITIISTIPLLSSLNAIIDNLLLFSIILLVWMKGIIVLYNKPKIMELFEMFDELNRQIRDHGEEAYAVAVIRECRVVLKIIIYSYFPAVSLLALSNILSDRGEGFWLSTALYPFEFAQLQWVYWSVFIFQGITNVINCFCATALDTYGVLLCNILGCHMDVLKYKLRTMGSSYVKNERDNDFRSELIVCIEYQRQCMRWVICI